MGSCFSGLTEILPFSIFKFGKTTSSEKYEVNGEDGKTNLPNGHLQNRNQDFRDQFESLAGADGEIDAYELQKILNEAFTAEFEFSGFSTDLCRSMVAMRDIDMSGKLGCAEAEDLWTHLHTWKAAFTKYDLDKNGYFYGHELESLLKHQGITLGSKTSKLLSTRFCDQSGKMWFPDYVSCMVKLRTAMELYEQKGQTNGGKVRMEQEEFMQATMYS